MKTLSVFAGVCLLSASVMAIEPSYSGSQAQQTHHPQGQSAQQQAAYPRASHQSSYTQAPQQSPHPGNPPQQPGGNVATRTVDVAKQQAEAEIQYEARRRVRGVFDKMFGR